MEEKKIEVRNWGHGGYVISEVSMSSINHACLTPTLIGAVRKGQQLARLYGIPLEVTVSAGAK